jgi:hypothetical protein
MLFEIVQTRDTVGGITEIKENPFDLARLSLATRCTSMS